RMPNFHFSEPEALALVGFLQTQRAIAGSWPELPQMSPPRAATDQGALSVTQMAEAKTESLVCLGCHTLGGQGGNRAVEWSNVSFRLQRDWVRDYLIEPRRFGVAPTNMPALFYRLSDDQQRFEAFVASPAEKIQLLTD